jgi:ribosomal protein S18 acetylase RimI-like enzyme
MINEEIKMIRRLGPQDIEKIEEFFSMLENDPETTSKFHPHIFDKKNAKLIANYEGRDLYFGTFNDDKMLAYGMLRFSVDYPDPSLGIAVRPGQQGHGLGGEMIDYMIASAKESGSPSISLFVYKKNPATHLYERKGFVLSQSKRNNDEWRGVLKF